MITTPSVWVVTTKMIVLFWAMWLNASNRPGLVPEWRNRSDGRISAWSNYRFGPTLDESSAMLPDWLTRLKSPARLVEVEWSNPVKFAGQLMEDFAIRFQHEKNPGARPG